MAASDDGVYAISVAASMVSMEIQNLRVYERRGLLTPDVPGSRGLLPLDLDRVTKVVGFLDNDFTTDFAVRVLTSRPASG